MASEVVLLADLLLRMVDCASGPRAPRPRPPGPSGASTWADGGTDRRALPAPGPRTNAAIGAAPAVTRRSGAPPARSRRHRGSPRVLPGTSAPRHSAPPTCSGVCRGSCGAGVTLQPEPCHPSAGADLSRVRRNQTRLRVGPRGFRTPNLRIRVRSRSAGQRAGCCLSCCIASLQCSLFRDASRSITGMRRGHASVRRCHYVRTPEPSRSRETVKAPNREACPT